MADQGFEDAGFSAEEEVVDTLGAYDEPAGAASRWGTGRRAAAAVGLAVALGAGGYGVALAANGTGVASAGAAAQPASLSSSASGGSAPGCGRAFGGMPFNGPGPGGMAFARGLAGTLKSDDGSTLTVQGPGVSSTTHTVTTTSSTVAVRIASGSVSDIANGDTVSVSGSYANNTLTAENIVTGDGLDLGTKTPQGSINVRTYGFASGTVADKTSTGFTVVTADGAHVTVVTSSSLTVETAVKIAVSALSVGKRVAVSGTSDANGTVTASQVDELDTTTGAPGFPGFGFGPGAGRGFGFGLRGPAQPGVTPPTRPSDAPSAAPDGRGGFGFRAHGGAPRTCGSVTPTPSASSGA